MAEEYVPKSQRDDQPDPIIIRNGLTGPVAEKQALGEMAQLLSIDKIRFASYGKVLSAVMYATKTSSLGETGKRVWLQEFSAALNRIGFLSNNNVQPFREWGYQYLRGYK